MEEDKKLLVVKNLTTVFPLRRGIVRAVDHIDFELREGEIMGLVGESGSGKSVSMLSILRLVAYPGKIIDGQIFFNGQDLLKKPLAEMRDIRGKEIAMIFQDPMTTLNPVFKVGEQVRESLRIHRIIKKQRRKFTWWGNQTHKRSEQRRVLELLEEVGLPSPKENYRQYPHELSGGMQQRALIAIALSCGPKLLLADEPTTALDVTIQAQILELLGRVTREHRTSMILVTHDLGVAAEFCHKIAVMYAGKIVEQGPTDKVLHDPKHPYTRGLLRSIPLITKEKVKIKSIPGNVPDLIDLPYNCAFYPRCEEVSPRCETEEIMLKEVAPDHWIRCVLYE
jgi:oligopeptide/dipeptide ABC transporter ATP-binding protein